LRKRKSKKKKKFDAAMLKSIMGGSPKRKKRERRRTTPRMQKNSKPGGNNKIGGSRVGGLHGPRINVRIIGKVEKVEGKGRRQQTKHKTRLLYQPSKGER